MSSPSSLSSTAQRPKPCCRSCAMKRSIDARVRSTDGEAPRGMKRIASGSPKTRSCKAGASSGVKDRIASRCVSIGSGTGRTYRRIVDVAEVRAFPALRYDVKVAGPLDDLICPPYDVISPEERAALVARSRGNFVHVELPRPTPEGYEEAAAFLARWRGDRALVPDPPSIYVHAHEFALGGVRAVRHGVFVALRLYPAGAGVVFPHELTFAKAKADRLELLRATRTNTSPIFGLVDGTVMSTLGSASV